MSRQEQHPTWTQPFLDRASIPGTSPLSAYLLRLMAKKQTNLCLSADVTTTSELLEVAEECGDSICILKTHCDIISDFGHRTVQGLLEISARKRFLIFEDRKFGDIGNTVQTQYAAGTHRIASWAAITNAHIFPGPAVITALKSAAETAISASGTTIATEIYGGDAPPGKRFPSENERYKVPPGSSGSDTADEGDQRERQAEREDVAAESEEEDEDSDDSQTQEGAPPPRSAADRKASVVSISTTISSSTEYVSPPPVTLTSSGATPDESSPHDMPPAARGLLLLAQMSSADNLFTPAYTSKCVELARKHRDFVMGFIAQEALNKEEEDNFVVMTPGVSMPKSASDTAKGSQSLSSKLQAKVGAAASAVRKQASPNPTTSKGDAMGQQYNDPRSMILSKGTDVIIVGRGILNAEDRQEEAERYRWEGWRVINERWGLKV